MASFTITAVSGKVGSDGTYRGYFNLANAPSAFWTAVDAAGATIRVFKGATRLPVDVVTIDKGAETGWLVFRGEFLAASDNEFTVDTDGSAFSPGSPVSLSITNPGAETGDTTGWTSTSGGLIAREDTSSTGDIAPHSGTYYFAGGNHALTVAPQDIAIPGAQEADVDAGIYAAKLVYWVGGYTDNDTAAMEIEFYDDVAAQIGEAVAHSPFDGEATWGERTLRVLVPAGTRTIRIIQRLERNSGTQNNGYIDDIALDLVDVGAYGPEHVWQEMWGMYALTGDLTDRTVHQHDLTVQRGSVQYAVAEMGLGGGIDTDSTTGGGAMQAASEAGIGIAGYTFFASVKRKTENSDNQTAMGFVRVYGSSDGRRLLGTTDSPDNNFAVFVSGGISFRYASTQAVLDTAFRIVGVHDADAATREIYVDGADDGFSGIQSGTIGTLWRFVLGGGNSAGADWLGELGFLGVYAGRQPDAEIAADADQLKDNAAFWSTGAAGTPPAKPVLTVDDIRENDADLSIAGFTAGEGGDHDKSQWRAYLSGGDPVADLVYDSDASNDLLAHTTDPDLPPGTTLDFEARVLETPSGLGSPWSDAVTETTDVDTTKPATPSVLTASGTTGVTATSSVYSHPGGLEHVASRWQTVVDGGDPDDEGDVVHDSGPDATALEAYTSPADVIPPETPLDQYVTHIDELGGEARSGPFDFTSSAIGIAGGGLFQFLDAPGGTVIESHQVTTDATEFVELLIEGMTRPAGAPFAQLVPLKLGSEEKSVTVRHASVDKGEMAIGFKPRPYMPEVDDFFDHGAVSASSTIDWSRGRFQTIDVDADLVATHLNARVGQELEIQLTQDGTGSRTIDLGATGEPTYSTPAGSVDYVKIRKTGTSTYIVVAEKIGIS